MTKVVMIEYPLAKNWTVVKDTALRTIWKTSNKEPTADWKLKLLASEHSPIRLLHYVWEWQDLPSWVSVHMVRHKFGIEHFVSSQRNDRQENYDRNSARQDAPVIHRCHANAQAIINISRKRLCKQASKETTEAWVLLVEALEKTSAELSLFCVPNCVYRGGICPEFKSCGYNRSPSFDKSMANYRKLHE